MDILVGGLVQAMAGLVAHVVALFRRFWPDADWNCPVEPIRGAAAVGVLAIAAPLGYLAIVSLQLTVLFLDDQLLLFLALLFGPMLMFAAVLAASGLAAGVAVALGVAAGSSGALSWAWAFVVVGALQVVTYLQLGWNLLAALAAAATAIEVALLGCLIHRVGTSLGSVTRV